MLFLKTSNFLSISMILWFMVACLSASSASTRSSHEKSARSSISKNPEKFLRTPLMQIGSLDKRGHDRDLELVYFEPGELLIPIQAAAEVLEAFYTGIAINANGPWANNAPRIWIRMTAGTIGLLMTATEGSTIPWDFVTLFALQMLGYTKRGYTGMYTANYVHPTAGNAIWVSLYQCAMGPLTDPAAANAPAKVASCLSASAQPWFPTRGTPTR